MNYVFVLDCEKKPLDPCHPARARKLLRAGRATLFRYFSFTIILNGRKVAESVTHAYRLKIDPGSRITGLALVQEAQNRVVWAAEIEHRGRKITKLMQKRARLRRLRRSRKTRFRQPRFRNRSRAEGWLPPSLQSRVSNIQTWVERLQRYCPIAAVSIELPKFDSQKLTNPEISGIEYRQGELQDYEMREYLLEKWNRTCAYCGQTGVPLEIEHIIPRSRSGSDRVSNLTLSCRPCNQRKGNQTAAEFGHPHIQAQARMPLRDMAAANTTRWAVFEVLQATGLPLEVGTGGHTKYNRSQQGYPKAHWIDAACVGESGERVIIPVNLLPLHIKATGHGRRQRCRTDKHGFPLQYAPRAKKYLGYQTGDMVRAIVPQGKYAGVHIGRVAIRFRPNFRLNGFDVHPQYLMLLQHADGYGYQHNASSE
jgi:5-methylcytosine-specific restriction endonuclease McrA